MRELFTDGIRLMFVLSIIPLVIYAVVGLFIAMIQTVTSIQEQAVSFLVKIILTAVLLLVAGPWMMQSLSDYSVRCFQAIELIGRS